MKRGLPRNRSPKRKLLTIRLAPALVRALETAARQRRVKRSDIIRHALRRALETNSARTTN